MDMSNMALGPGRILFVDDEKNILHSLEREFIDTDYEIFLAGSAREALGVMEQENIDVLVTDYKMPGADGMELLKTVKKQYPAVYRVILSGFVEQHLVLRALSSGLVTAYIPKPWETEALLEKIGHLFTTRRALKSAEMLKAINSIEELPVLSGVYHEFAQAVEEERPYNDLALIIAHDVATTAKLLRIASSAYYNLERNTSIERALSYIGLNAIKEILLLTSLADLSAREGSERLELRRISTHSVLVNSGIFELYKLKTGIALPQHYSSVGITHDIGKIIMLGYLPDRFRAATSAAKGRSDTDFYEAEVALGFGGTTHAEIGAYFLDLWGLPTTSVEACLYHHNPESCMGGDSGILNICKSANLLANYVALHPDAAGALPAFLEGYPGPESLLDLMESLRDKWQKSEAS